MITVHTDVVGSLLRPPELLEARDHLQHGRIPPAEFKAIEDRAVDQAVRLQADAGVDVVTDGEMRRLSFQSRIVESVEGFARCELDDFLWGHWRGDESTGDLTKARPEGLGVVGRLRRKHSLSTEEFVYLRARTDRIPKISLPSPSLLANFWDPKVSHTAYPTLEGFLTDVTAILREEVEELVSLGARYIQLDAPHYPLLLDPKTRHFYESQGWPPEKWLEHGIELDNALMQDLPDVTFGFHLCRGNQAGRWLVEGGYDPIAHPIFRRTLADRLLLEYDDPRSGGFEPLQSVPQDKMVVLGLVTTKSPRQETQEWLTNQINDAGRYFPKAQLALSPQCGFSSSILGNTLSFADQERKLRLVAETARSVWG